jgi:hypothetical protein
MERQALGYSLGRAKCRHGNGVRTSFLSKPWMARRLAGRHALTAPRCRASREGPGVRAILAAPLALEAGPGPLPPHARSNSGAGPPMASASPGGERATLPGAVLAVGGPVPCAGTLKPRPCGGRMPPQSSAMDGSCPDGPGHGAASGPGYCRGPVAERRGTMGRYLRAMTGPSSRQAPAGWGAGYLAAPRPYPDLGSRDGGPLFAGHAPASPHQLGQ